MSDNRAIPLSRQINSDAPQLWGNQATGQVEVFVIEWQRPQSKPRKLSCLWSLALRLLIVIQTDYY